MLGGINPYVYVFNDPVNGVDPLGLERQFSLGSSIAGFAPILGLLGFGASGGSAFGVSIGNSICDTQLFYSGQYNMMVGAGAYIGANGTVGVGRTDGPLKRGWEADVKVHGEFNAATGISLGFSVDVDIDSAKKAWEAKDLTAISENGTNAGAIKPGIGEGIMSGIGLGVVTTYGTPTFGEIFPSLCGSCDKEEFTHEFTWL